VGRRAPQRHAVVVLKLRNSIVWWRSGEEIVSTYPFSTYAAGWGTSFSAPFVFRGAGLLRSLNTSTNQNARTAAAVAHAVPQRSLAWVMEDWTAAGSYIGATTQRRFAGLHGFAAPSTQTITADKRRILLSLPRHRGDSIKR